MFLNREASGTISNSVTWCSGTQYLIVPRAQIHVIRNVTVVSGATLTIEGGALVKFWPGVSLTVNGTLNAIDNTYYPGSGRITFTSNSPSSTWNGIVLNGTGANGSTLNYCMVERVETYSGSAITVIGATGVTVSYCTISNNWNWDTSALTFHNAGNPNIYHNTITSNGGWGVALHNTSGNIWVNTITSDFIGGVLCNSLSSPSFGKVGYFFGLGNGNNTITGGYWGVYANNQSSPYIGSQSTTSFGYNRITSNTAARVYAGVFSNPLAEQNWWGSSSPDPAWFETYYYSTIDWDPWLTSDPGPAQKVIPVASAPIVFARQVGASSSSAQSGNDWREVLRMAVEQRVNGRYNDAKQLLKTIISASPTSLEAIYGAAELLQVYRSTQDNDILEFTETVMKQKSGADPHLQLIYAKMLWIGSQTSEAQSMLRQIASANAKTQYEKLALLDLFYLYYATTQYATQLSAPLEILLANHGDDPDVKEAVWLYQVKTGLQPPRAFRIGSLSNAVFDKEIVLQNFPNPFNPSTVISYQLPTGGHVTLKIYNTLGQEVATLVDGFEEAGVKAVTFNASHLASGVYFYRLQTSGIIQVKKLIMAK